ncbi:MAG: hypothetical protein JWR85_3164 [Marmoricola sp.]|nr:hypothetical protein [Marmoricola sp.]
MRERVRELDGRILDSRTKALPLGPQDGFEAERVAARKWNVLDGDLDFPALVLKERELANNIAVMAAYCDHHGVDLAPHGKTSMAPQLFERQLDAGAWGITAATVSQCRTMRSFGVPRILLANELVDARGIRWVLDEIEQSQREGNADFEFLCYVDSVAGIEIIEDVVASRPGQGRLPVLVELGYDAGRTGCRTVTEAVALAERAGSSDAVELRGVAGFEGLMPGDSVEDVISAIDHYLGDLQLLVRMVYAAGLCGGNRIVVSAGGSAYFDRVVLSLAPAEFEFPVQTILRSGCYITHDAEMYELTSPLAGRPGSGQHLLQPALELWATVWSRPAPTLAILGFGKRDSPYDYRLPVPLEARKVGSKEARDVRETFHLLDLNDQHAFVRIPEDDPLEVGDRVVCGVSHPCGAFDKWAYIPVVDPHYTVIDGIFTFF